MKLHLRTRPSSNYVVLAMRTVVVRHVSHILFQASFAVYVDLYLSLYYATGITLKVIDLRCREIPSRVDRQQCEVFPELGATPQYAYFVALRDRRSEGRSCREVSDRRVVSA